MNSTFVDRQDQIKVFKKFLEPNNKKWILYFFGEGGTGKTSLINELSNNYCSGIPKAYLNFLYENTDSYENIIQSLGNLFPSGGKWYREVQEKISKKTHPKPSSISSTIIQLGIANEVTSAIRSEERDINLWLYWQEKEVRHQLASEFLEKMREFRNKTVILFLDQFEVISDQRGTDLDRWLHEEILLPAKNVAPNLKVVIAGDVEYRYKKQRFKDAYLFELLDILPEGAFHELLNNIGISDAVVREKIYYEAQSFPAFLGLITDYWMQNGDNFSDHNLDEFFASRYGKASSDLAMNKILMRLQNDHWLFPTIKKGAVLQWLDRSALKDFLQIPDEKQLDFDNHLIENLPKYSFVVSDGHRIKPKERLILFNMLRDDYLNLIDMSFKDWHEKAQSYYARILNLSWNDQTRAKILSAQIYHLFFIKQEDAIDLWYRTLYIARIEWQEFSSWTRILELPMKEEIQNLIKQPEKDFLFSFIKESLGDYHYLKSDNQNALKLYNEAIEFILPYGDRRKVNIKLAQLYTKKAFLHPKEEPGGNLKARELLYDACQIVPPDDDEIIPVSLKYAINLYEGMEEGQDIDRQLVLDKAQKVLEYIDQWRNKVDPIRKIRLRAEEARTYDLLGNIYFTLFNDFDRAITNHKKAIDEAANRPDLLGVFWNNLGVDYYLQGGNELTDDILQKTKNFYLKALEEFEKLPGYKPIYVGMIHNNLGEVCYRLHLPKLGDKHFTLAGKLLRSTNWDAYLLMRFLRAYVRLMTGYSVTRDEIDKAYIRVETRYKRIGKEPPEFIRDYYNEAINFLAGKTNTEKSIKL